MTTAKLIADVLGAIDKDRFAELRRKHAADSAAKYLDLDVWIARNVARARRVGLHMRRGARVLDLGCGCGYFLHICKVLGHEVVGVDIVKPGIYADITAMLDVTVLDWRVTAEDPLPPLTGRPFDVITAHMVTFNGHRGEPWGPAEWTRFLDTAELQLVNDGALHLELNREPDGIMYQRGVAELFGARGGVLTERHVVFAPLRGPSRAAGRVR